MFDITNEHLFNKATWHTLKCSFGSHTNPIFLNISYEIDKACNINEYNGIMCIKIRQFNIIALQNIYKNINIKCKQCYFSSTPYKQHGKVICMQYPVISLSQMTRYKWPNSLW